jgi:hypothetical protein
MTKSCSDSSHIENIRLPYDDSTWNVRELLKKKTDANIDGSLWKILDEECCFLKLSLAAANRAAAEAVR